MTRIRGETLAEIQFRQNDTPPTRAQKLELIRAAVMTLQNAAEDEDDPDIIISGTGIETYRIPGYFVETPAADETLHLRSVTRDIHFYPTFAGSEAAIGVLPDDDFVLTVFRNPTMAGVEITGGEIIGTLTYGDSGGVQWATTDDMPIQLLDGDVLGIKAPADVDATAALGAFTLVAWIGFAANLEGLTEEDATEEFAVLLSGDMQDSGEDRVWLSGDEGFNDIGSPPESEGVSVLYPTGPQGARGPAGADGADGKTVLNGAGAPGAGLGVDGDFYIDTTADAIYGPKTAGAWGASTSLIGPQGPAGADGSDGNGLIGIQVITATGAGIYAPTAGTNSIIIEVQAGGGGGGGVQSAGGTAVALAAGGGGGGWLRKRLTANFNGAAYSVGAKGNGGAAGNNAGAAGSNSFFTTTGGAPVTYTALGGTGGAQLGPTTPSLPGGGAAGGATSGGAPDQSRPGGASVMGIATATSRGITSGGGSSFYSAGAPQTFWDGANMSQAGANADGKGGGGAGAMSGATGVAKAGGNGSDGIIIIREYA